MQIARILLCLWLPAIACGACAPAGGPEDVLVQLGVETDAADLPAAPVPGFLEVVRGTDVLYVSRDGRLLIDGDILSVANEINLTERRRATIRRTLIDAVPLDQRIVLPADGPVRARAVVFADTDCPYCLKLHRQREDFARNGIEIHYLFFPRSGPSGDSYGQAVAVWCAPDRLAALDRALAGEELAPADCANPVESHYELGRRLGLRGTPAVVDAAGGIRYGIVAAGELLQAESRAGRAAAPGP